MENVTNDTNQNNVDVHQETKYQNGGLNHEGDSSVFVDNTAPMDSFVSTSPSKQKVNAAINEVINDRLLPSEPAKKDMDKEVVNEIMSDVVNSVEENTSSRVVETNSISNESNVDLKNNDVESLVEGVNSENTITENHSTPQTNEAVNVEKPEVVNNNIDVLSNNNSVINKNTGTDSSEVSKNITEIGKESCPVDDISKNGVVDIKQKDTREVIKDISKSESAPSLASKMEDTPKPSPIELNDNSNNAGKAQIENTTDVTEIIPEQPTITTTEKSAENEETANSEILEKETDTENTIEKTESKPIEWLDILGNGLLKKKVTCSVTSFYLCNNQIGFLQSSSSFLISPNK